MSKMAAVLLPVRDDDDLDAINAGNPTWIGSSLIRSRMRSAEHGATVWLVAEVDGASAGYAHATFPPADATNRDARVHLWVKPQARGNGIGHQLWSAILEPLASVGADRVTSSGDSDDGDSLAWAQRLGAELGAYRVQSSLELSTLTPIATELPDDVSLATLPEDATEKDWSFFYEAYERASADTPDGQAGRAPMPYAMMRMYVPGSWQACVARDQENLIVGLTCVFVRNSMTREVNTLITGVDRRWRGKGLSVALKYEHARLLAAAGWQSLVTQNMVGNAPILAANRRLGFRPQTTLVDIALNL
jgi:GNAT superfamily N-acetyltransferase